MAINTVVPPHRGSCPSLPQHARTPECPDVQCLGKEKAETTALNSRLFNFSLLATTPQQLDFYFRLFAIASLHLADDRGDCEGGRESVLEVIIPSLDEV